MKLPSYSFILFIAITLLFKFKMFGTFLVYSYLRQACGCRSDEIKVSQKRDA